MVKIFILALFSNSSKKGMILIVIAFFTLSADTEYF